MLLSFLFIVLGLALLVGGGELLVRGASQLALLARVSPAVVGLTVVAAGTSMPEMVVSVQAALAGNPGISVGNVVGSNIFNIALILGVAAVIRPLSIQGNSVRMEWPVMFLASLQMHLLSRDGTVDRFEGACLLSALVAFVGYSVWMARRELPADEHVQFAAPTPPQAGSTTRAWAINAFWVLLGIGLLVAGSDTLVRGAVAVASTLGVSDTVIGLTVVAAGTSTPELAASAVASWRGKDDIAVANVLGSNIFNVLGIAGTTAVIADLPVPDQIVAWDNWWMIGFAVLLFPLMRTSHRISRLEGAVLLGGFVTYITLVVVRA